MSQIQWWVQTDGLIQGPWAAGRLRDLARSGAIGHETLVSRDKVQWVPARRLKGLFEDVPSIGAPEAAGRPDRNSAPRPDHDSTAKPQRASEVGASGHESPVNVGSGRDDTRFPVVRVRGGFFWSQVIAIYETHLLTGNRFLRRLELTEEMCHPSGEAALRRHLHASRSVALGKGSEVRETASTGKRRAFSLSSGKQSHHFSVRESGGNMIEFSVSSTQVRGIHAALFGLLGDAYYSRPDQRGGCAAVAIAFLGVPFLLLAAIYSGNGSSVISLIAAVVGLGLTGGGLYLIFARRGDWTQVTELPTLVIDKTARERTTVVQASQPFHSQTLGWTLKLLGLAYWVVIASPLTDGMEKPIEEATKNNLHIRNMIWAIIWAPSPLMIYLGYQMCHRRYDPKQKGDTRKPILFLRPFEDDAKTSLQPPGLLSAITGVRGTLSAKPSSLLGKDDGGRISVMEMVLMSNPARLLRMVFNLGAGSSEETIARYFESYGPVVAIGRPGEGLTTPGAARVYLADNDWRAVVLDELKKSQAVVMQPGSTEGVRWELERIREHVEPYKVLLCLVSFWKDPEGFDDLARLVGRTFHVDLPRVVPFLDRPSFVYFDAGWVPRLQEVSYKCPVLWPLTGEATDLGYSLHPFAQGMHGGDREPPRPPLWKLGLGNAFAGASAVALGLVLAIVPVLTVHYVAQSLFGSWVATAPEPGTLTATPVPEQIPQVVARSPRVTLTGRAVPYRFEIPEALLKGNTEDESLEHVRKSPDQRLVVQVIALDESGDVSDIAEQRLKINSGKGILKSTLESSRTVSVADIDWAEARIFATLENGVTVREISRGANFAKGTVYVIVFVIGVPEPDPAYLNVAEEILASFRFEKKSEEIFKIDDMETPK